MKLSEAWRALGKFAEREGFNNMEEQRRSLSWKVNDVFLCQLLKRAKIPVVRQEEIQAVIDLFLDTNEESRVVLFLSDYDNDDGGAGIRALFCYNMAELEKSLGS